MGIIGDFDRGYQIPEFLLLQALQQFSAVPPIPDHLWGI
jgi:hypothetical protein